MNPLINAEQERILSIMALARNARLGEEFHEQLIKSNLSVEQAMQYVDAMFESYSTAVANSFYSVERPHHIELFTKGFCQVTSIDDFLNSQIGCFISKVYGKLHYSEQPRTNFLKVFRQGASLYVSENLFYDRFPGVQYLGSIVPECLNYLTKVDERGGDSPIGRMLGDFGYAIKHTPMKPSTVDWVKNRFYIDCDFDIETEVSEQQTDHNFKALAPADAKKQLFQITAEYYNAIMSGDKWHALSFLKEYEETNKKDIQFLFSGNRTLGVAKNERTCLQRMENGNSMFRHFDSNTSGYDNYLINVITWVCQGDFRGRELVLGKRSEADLDKWLMDAINAKDNMDSYSLEPQEYNDTCTVAPESFKSVIINSFNPVFYHGVNELVGSGFVYTITNDFQPA